ncbi:DUF2332 domain-containing protein [Nocardioides panacis]|uniref:DUF2332 domain-containing protein n=1 Tax=Nocardioides panacis TaxID=2849501 RepID=A0A975SXI9_9ACTN|nr:DUF2332 domain-containing protein [Nocardioides panacis]QWZ07757.1 DUF2332 domain-containing protein [Nocardioides panacis]
MNPVGGEETAQSYRDFAEQARGSSACFTDWALAVAADPEVLALVESLPAAKRQPNLVLAAARWHGAPAPGPYDGLRTVLLDDWDAVRATVLSRATQTNEVGRCATLLPVLAGLPGPLALLEVGASAGLCLYPDRYSYRYPGHPLDPVDGPSRVLLECLVDGDPPLPDALPEVVWRGGIDLNPLDVRDDDAMRWLRTLVWPEHEDRRTRLAAAVDLAREDPPTLVRGDLNDALPDLVEQAPEDATLVVFHSAVLAYLSAQDRDLFALQMAVTPGHWVANEGPRVLPTVAATAPEGPPPGAVVGPAPFLLALDGRAVAWTEPHGRALTWR